MADLEIGRLDAVIIDSVAFYGDFQPNSPDTYKVLEVNLLLSSMPLALKKALML